MPGDVSDVATVVGMVEGVMSRFGRTSLDDWNRTLAVNLTGPFLMCREFGREMLGLGSGSIVNVSSVAGLLGISTAPRTTRASTA